MIHDPVRWRDAVEHGRILWRAHAVGRMLQRSISRSEVIEILLACDPIEEYANDQPYPSVLLIGQCDTRILHVVAAFDDVSDQVCVITAYEPDLDHFEDDLRRRRRDDSV